MFIGFQNKACTNLCVSTDGIALEIRVSGLQDLIKNVFDLLGSYNMRMQLDTMREFGKYALSEHQFAQMIGKARLYQYLPAAQKKEIPALTFNDSQFNAVARDYYTDKSFCRDVNGDINLWKLFGLFTGANKSSYIDSFLGRSVYLLIPFPFWMIFIPEPWFYEKAIPATGAEETDTRDMFIPFFR